MKIKSEGIVLYLVEIPIELNQLKEELRKERLRTELLNAMIDIAEKDLKINIRKKSGTKL